MAFHVRITLTEVNKKAQRAIIALGDTVVIDAAGAPLILTEGIQRKYNEISYSLDQEVEQGNGKSGKPASQDNEDEDDDEDMLNQAAADLFTETRLRPKNIDQHNNEEARKATQEEL
jgi:hypothetical protein